MTNRWSRLGGTPKIEATITFGARASATLLAVPLPVGASRAAGAQPARMTSNAHKRLASRRVVIELDLVKSAEFGLSRTVSRGGADFQFRSRGRTQAIGARLSNCVRALRLKNEFVLYCATHLELHQFHPVRQLMKRQGTFAVAFGFLIVLQVVGLLYFVNTDLQTTLPKTFGPVPVGVPWFGALGAVLLSLKGIFDHHYDWNETYWPWHLSRPFIGAALSVVGVLILQAGILAVGSDPTPNRPALTGQAAVATPTSAAGRPPASPQASGATTVAPGELPPGVSVSIPANLLYYLVGFLVGYREETFRALLRRLTDVILSPGEERKPAP